MGSLAFRGGEPGDAMSNPGDTRQLMQVEADRAVDTLGALGFTLDVSQLLVYTQFSHFQAALGPKRHLADDYPPQARRVKRIARRAIERVMCLYVGDDDRDDRLEWIMDRLLDCVTKPPPGLVRSRLLIQLTVNARRAHPFGDVERMDARIWHALISDAKQSIARVDRRLAEGEWGWEFKYGAWFFPQRLRNELSLLVYKAEISIRGMDAACAPSYIQTMPSGTLALLRNVAGLCRNLIDFEARGLRGSWSRIPFWFCPGSRVLIEVPGSKGSTVGRIAEAVGPYAKVLPEDEGDSQIVHIDDVLDYKLGAEQETQPRMPGQIRTLGFRDNWGARR